MYLTKEQIDEVCDHIKAEERPIKWHVDVADGTYEKEVIEQLKDIMSQLNINK